MDNRLVKRVLLILAHDALRRGAAAFARAAGVPVGGPVSVHLGRWHQGTCTRTPEAGMVWPDGHPHGGEWVAYPSRIERGPFVTVAWEVSYDGPGEIFLALTAREVTGAEAERLRAERTEREEEWERECARAEGSDGGGLG